MMATYYSSQGSERDSQNMYSRDPTGTSALGNLLYLNNPASGPYTEFSGILQSQQDCIEMPEAGHPSFMSQGASARESDHQGQRSFGLAKDMKNEMLMHMMDGSADLINGDARNGIQLDFGHGSSNEIPSVQGQALLSLSLNTQIMAPYWSVKADDGGGLRVDDIRMKSVQHKTAIRNSRYLKAAQELLDEAVNVWKNMKQKEPGKTDDGKETEGVSSNPQASSGAPELSTAERQELQNKMAKLLAMLDEVDRKYKRYYHQMQSVVSSFDVVAGPGAAKPYTAVALRTISRHFRCLKDAVDDQVNVVRRKLGEEESSSGSGKLTRLRYIDQQLRQQRAFQQYGMIPQQNAWRPQRGLPENSVTVLRAWLFEHFLHPYPKDSEKLMLARQTGLTRSQISNWFINARVRLWKPMIEDMYKVEEIGDDTAEQDSNSSSDKQAPRSKAKVASSQDKEDLVSESRASTRTNIAAQQLGDQASSSSNWASRNLGLHYLRQRLHKTGIPRRSTHLSQDCQPPFPTPRSFADVVKRVVSSGDTLSSSRRTGAMAKDSSDAAGWRVVDHRRQQVRGRPSGPGSGPFRGRGSWEVRGRGTWRGRGGRFLAPVTSFGSVDMAAMNLGRGVQSEAARKRVAEVAPGVSDMGKKRREDLCCEICEDNHVPEECPVFNGPKPQAALCGFAGGESGFFQIPTWGSKGAVSSSDGVTAFITVKEGNVSADLVKSELSRLIPVKWNWSVQKHADGFLVPFPCRVELQRMIAMKYVHTLGGEGILVIQEVNQKIEPIAYLQKAWVNVYGVPFEIRSFLPLWAIGTILGATQKVDMRYTRKMGVVRILVAVTNVNHIPESAEIVVGEGLYEIFFKVDKVLKEGKWVDNDIIGTQDGDDKGQGEDEDCSEKHENDSFQLEELAKDTVMDDSSLQNDSNKPQDGACDMGMVSQLEKPNSIGSVAGMGIEAEGLSLGMPEDVMTLTSPGADQYVGVQASGALAQSPGYGCGVGKSKFRLEQNPGCSSLANVSQGEVGAVGPLFQIESAPLAGTGASLVVEDIISQSKVAFELDDDHINSADTQDALVSNSLTKRVKTEKLNQGDIIISAKRTNTDEDILTKAERLAAKRNLELGHFQRYPLVQILETSTEAGITTTNHRCLSSFGSGGDGSLCKSWMALKCKN